MTQEYFKRIKKTITGEIRKDGNYPKHLHRQITTGLQQTADLISEFREEQKKFEEQLLYQAKKYSLPFTYATNHKWDNTPIGIDTNRLPIGTTLGKDYPEAYAWTQVKGLGASITSD